MKTKLFTVLAIVISFVSVAQPIIPLTRVIDWSQAGIPGGIPYRTTIFCNVQNAPYNATGNGTTDDTQAIQNAINACPAGQVVYIPSGTYKISGALGINKGISVRGAGPGNTILKMVGGEINIYTSTYSANWDFSQSTSYAITNGMTKGSTTLTTSGNHGWVQGNIILIDQLNDGVNVTANGGSGTCTWCGRANGSRASGQLVEVISSTSNTITFSPALYNTYLTSLTAQATQLKGTIKNFGMEDITINNINTSPSNPIQMHGTIYSWFRNVESIGAKGRHLEIYHNFRNEFRQNNFHHSNSNYGPNTGYGVFFGLMCTANLFEDNIMYALHVPISLEGGPAGNVIIYNMITDVRYNDPEWAQGAIVEHGAHPYMNLIESNQIESKIVGDNYWGTASHNTYYRNRIFIAPSSNFNYGSWLFDLYIGHRYENIVGNIMGTQSYEGRYEMENLNFSSVYYCDPTCTLGKSIYKLGYEDGGDSDPQGNDPLVKSTMYRHGNFDYVTNTVNWDNTNSNHTLPGSFYHATRPTWWPTCTAWPAIGPDVSGYVQPIPAKLRYDAMINNGNAPVVTAQPQNITVNINQTANFSLTATGYNPKCYQWHKNGVAIIGANNTNYTTPPVAMIDNGSVFYCVVSNGAGVDTSANAILNVLSTGLNEASLSSSIAIYPNPSTGFFTMQLPSIGKFNVEILNAEGQKVYAISFEDRSLNDLDLTELAEGMYFVKVKSNESSAIKKLVIQK